MSEYNIDHNYVPTEVLSSYDFVELDGRILVSVNDIVSVHLHDGEMHEYDNTSITTFIDVAMRPVPEKGIRVRYKDVDKAREEYRQLKNKLLNIEDNEDDD